MVQPCNASSSGGLWCCRTDATQDCCATSAKSIDVGQFIVATTAVITSTATTTTSGSQRTGSTGSLCFGSAGSNTTQTHCSSKNSTVAGVGASLGVALMLSICALCFQEWRWRKRRTIQTADAVKGQDMVSQPIAYEKHSRQLYEIGSGR